MAVSILDQFRLDGRTALVVGGNRGLGFEMAKALAEAGASIFIAARDEQRNETVARLTLLNITSASVPRPCATSPITSKWRARSRPP